MAAVLLASIGLLALYLTARAQQAAPVRIGDITPLMGFANVTVTGRVTRTPFVGEAGDYVMFRVDDGSGELRIAAHDAVAEALIARNQLPVAGSDIRLSGELSISARRGTRLYLRDAADLVLTAIPSPTAPP